jgi:hypothetical protein
MSTSTPGYAQATAPGTASETSPESASDLQRAYIWSINSAIETGGGDLAAELANGYRRESHEMIDSIRERPAA